MGMNQHSKHAIEKLILKSIIEDIDSKERALLDEWLEKEDNRKLYDSIVSPERINAKQNFYNSIDKDAAYKRVTSIIASNKTQKRKKYIAGMYKYAAILIIALLVSVYIFKNFKTSDQITEENLVEINAGHPKATLVLSNGKEVDLGAHQNETIFSSGHTQINNTNKTLEYKIEDNNDDLAEVGYNTLYIPIGGIYNVILPDGSKVWLNSNSTLKFPEAFTGDTREVVLEGEAYFEVVKNKGQFIVHTKNQDVTVLGTSFNVSAYKSDNFFSSTLVEGKVRLSSEQTGEVVLTPGKRGYLKFDNDPKVFLSDVDVRNFSAWKDGVFFFDNENLEAILTKIGRWYGFKVSFQQEELKSIPFTGVAKKDTPIKKVLDMIAKTSEVKYQVNKNNDEYEIKILK